MRAASRGAPRRRHRVLLGALDLNLKLEDLATNTDDIEERSFTSRFFASLFARLTQWFAEATNGIKSFFAERVQTKELCVDYICVTREEFLPMNEGSVSSRRRSDRGTRSAKRPIRL